MCTEHVLREDAGRAPVALKDQSPALVLEELGMSHSVLGGRGESYIQLKRPAFLSHELQVRCPRR